MTLFQEEKEKEKEKKNAKHRTTLNTRISSQAEAIMLKKATC